MDEWTRREYETEYDTVRQYAPFDDPRPASADGPAAQQHLGHAPCRVAATATTRAATAAATAVGVAATPVLVQVQLAVA